MSSPASPSILSFDFFFFRDLTTQYNFNMVPKTMTEMSPAMSPMVVLGMERVPWVCESSRAASAVGRTERTSAIWSGIWESKLLRV